MTNVTNPVAGGYVASLARPGGNVTGLTHMTGELSGKRLELLKEAFPKVSRVAFFINPDLANSLVGLREAEGVAGALGVKIQPRAIQASKDFEGALAAIAQEHDEALIIMGTSILIAHSAWIVNFARMHRLPAIYDRRRIVENGGLMSYGASLSDHLRRAATYVDKILKGVKPADLPVEQPTKFELVINLKEAKRTGLTVSPKVLRWADEVIK